MGQKQKTEGEKRRRKKERLKVGNNKGQLYIANATSGEARKGTWAKIPNHAVFTEHPVF